MVSALSPTLGVQVDLGELLRLRGLARGLNLSNHRLMTQTLGGQHASSIRGRGMEFDEVRLYQPGDDVQRIDWRVSSRTGKLHTKLFREERQKPVFIVVDQRNAMFFGSMVAFKSVVAARIGALLAWGALHNHDKIGGMVMGPEANAFLKPVAGKRGVLRYLHHLARSSAALLNRSVASEPLSFHDVLRELVRTVHPGSLVSFISDFSDFNEEAFQCLKMLRRHNDVLCLNVFDPLEKELPPANLYGMSDGKRELLVNTRNERLRSTFAHDYEERLRCLRTRCESIAVPLMEIGTGDDLGGRFARIFGGTGTQKGRDYEA